MPPWHVARLSYLAAAVLFANVVSAAAEGFPAATDLETASQTPVGQTIEDVIMAAGGTVAPGWAKTLAAIPNYATDAELIKQRDGFQLAQRAVDFTTVWAAGAAGAPFGAAPVTAAVAQGAIDVGKFVVAPWAGDILVRRFPSLFIPPSKNIAIELDPFTQRPIGSASQTQASNTQRPQAVVTSTRPIVTPVTTPTTRGSESKATELEALKNKAVSLQPPQTLSVVQPLARDLSPSRTPFTGFQPLGPAVPLRSGAAGVSLSRAAAERMPLNIDLDSVYYAEGKIVLSGNAAAPVIDAALFLTTLRVACEEQDLYFSLNPDNGALWTQQGEQAFDDLWSRIQRDFVQRTLAVGAAEIRTVSARKDYPEIWRQLAPRYPNFRSKLVFNPEWLSRTRVGEILYKADVLLKELSSGVPVLVPGRLRATSVPGYLSADTERAAAFLNGSIGQNDRTKWVRGSRLWFDIAPPPAISASGVYIAPRREPANSELVTLLRARGWIRQPVAANQSAPIVVRDGNIFDFSMARPRMFVRIHDHVTDQDLADHDPDLDGLASDVSLRFDEYASVYDELRVLRDVFRSYIMAVRIVEANARLCDRLDQLPLLETEKTGSQLPAYHPSELFVTVASYRPTTTSRAPMTVSASSMNGGVSVSARRFLESAVREGETQITREIRRRIATNDFSDVAASDSPRRFISLDLGELIAPQIIASSLPGAPLEGRIENEPPAATLPAYAILENRARGDARLWAVVILAAIVLYFLFRPRRSGRKRRA